MHRLWVRYELDGRVGFGTLEGDRVAEYHGDLFGAPKARAGAASRCARRGGSRPRSRPRSSRCGTTSARCARSSSLRGARGTALFPEVAELVDCARRADPQPRDDGKVVFEGELGIVIGKTCSAVPEEQALEHVFGYTCANDVTVADILQRDKSFAQWARAKCFDTFCPMGPAVATGLDPRRFA